jgi:FkbM family methyltransferase
MEIIDGHLIDTDLLKENDWILDAGCRDFTLKHGLKGKYKFLCLDPDPDVKGIKGVKFENIALMPHEGEVDYCGWSTGGGNYCYKTEAPWYADKDIKVNCNTIKNLMTKYKIKKFGLAKIDIEGGEYDFLLSIDFPFAKQIAVEFHQSVGHNPYGTHEEYLLKLFASPFGQLYYVAEHYEYDHCKGIYEYHFRLKDEAGSNL